MACIKQMCTVAACLRLQSTTWMGVVGDYYSYMCISCSVIHSVHSILLLNGSSDEQDTVFRCYYTDKWGKQVGQSAGEKETGQRHCGTWAKMCTWEGMPGERLRQEGDKQIGRGNQRRESRDEEGEDEHRGGEESVLLLI